MIAKRILYITITLAVVVVFSVYGFRVWESNRLAATPGTDKPGTAVATPSPSSTAPSASSTPDKSHIVVEAYSSQRPILMGLSISDDRTKVTGLFGNPPDRYIMEDPSDPIEVLVYDAFSVGIDSVNKVRFVTIHSAEVDPGLNGLRLDAKSSDAIKALGTPDTNTSYVLAYYNKNTVLKLDIDPKTTIVQSIKLFADAK